MASPDCDVVIVGAGFAGAAAAVTLAARGVSAIVLEARDRAGGRAHSRSFGGEDGDRLEFGGSWLKPPQQRIRHHLSATGGSLAPRPPVTERRWLRDGIVADSPVSEAEAAAYRALVERLKADAARASDEELQRTSFADYLDRLGASPAARSVLGAWWTVSGCGAHHKVSAAEFLTCCSYGDGTPDGYMDVLADAIAGGAQGLVERMLAASGCEVRLNCPVESIASNAEGVVAAGSGMRVRARRAIVAVPLNALSGILFAPPLSPAKREALARGHEGFGCKAWLRAEGVPPGVLALGGGDGLEWLWSDRRASDGTTLIVGFSRGDGRGTELREADIERSFHRAFPEGRLVAFDRHDWNADPFSRGAWLSVPAEMPDIGDPERWHAEGPVVFAGSDVARRDGGWFEGAIVSGEDAADAVLRSLKP